MARTALRAIDGLRRFNRWLHYSAGVALTAMLAIQVTNIIGRKFFDWPVVGTVELTRMLLAVVVFLGLAHSEDLGDHITIDILYVRMGRMMRGVLNVFANVLSTAVIALLAYRLYRYIFFTRGTGEETGILEWPIWPFVVIAAFGSAVFALAIASKLVLRRLGEPVDADAPQSIGEVDLGGAEI